MKNIVLALVAVVFLSACGGGDKDKLVKIKTSKGDMTVLLYDETPLHKANFLELAESGKYDSTIFHRVIDNFMIQGGDIYKNSGEQEPASERIPAEIQTKYLHTKGALAAARQPDQSNPEKQSSSCQFYIVDGQSWEDMSVDLVTLYSKFETMLRDTVNYPHLFQKFIEFRQANDQSGYQKWVVSQRDVIEDTFDIDLFKEPRTMDNEAYESAGGGYAPLDGEYTVFGRVVEGLEVIDQIAAVKTTQLSQFERDVPVEPIHISMEVISMSKSDITEKYGYEYPQQEK